MPAMPFPFASVRLPSLFRTYSPSLPVVNPNPASPTRHLSLNFLSFASAVPIPADLSLEHVLSSSLCHPLTIADFASFLRTTDRAHENLAFVLWFRDYERRFWALEEDVRARAEVIDPREEMEKYLSRKATERQREMLEKVPTNESDQTVPCAPGTAPWDSIDLDALEAGRPLDVADDAVPAAVGEKANEGPADAAAVPELPVLNAETLAIAPWIVEEAGEEAQKRMTKILASADEELEKTVQLLIRDDMPLRDEIVRIALHFLTLSSPSALSSQHIPALLLTLRRTTHPYAFRALYQELYTYLLLDAHPRFIRASLANIRTPVRACLYVCSIGIYLCGGIATGLACVLCPGIARGWRAFSCPLVWAGFWGVLCLLNGICPIAFSIKGRQLALWEELPELTAGERGKGKGKGKGKDGDRSKRPGMFAFIVNDWWAGHPAARKMQMSVMLAAARWGFLAMVVWAAIILSVPARVPGYA